MTPPCITTDHGELPIWVPFSERAPCEGDGNEYGDVDVSEGRDCWEAAFDHRPINATHWRRIILPAAATIAADSVSSSYDFNL